MSKNVVVDVDAIVDALKSMPLPDGLAAHGLILDFDEATQDVIARIALVLDFDEWSAEALDACDSARSSAWRALGPLDVVPNVLLRLASEHEALSAREPAWITLNGDR